MGKGGKWEETDGKATGGVKNSENMIAQRLFPLFPLSRFSSYTRGPYQISVFLT
jgi:hypothetical protein